MNRWKKAWALLLFIPVMAGIQGFASFSDMPAQPINFSHRIMAGDNKIPCMYCHIDARRSPTAGMPPVDRCMGCHKLILPNNPAVVKLKWYFESGTSPNWNRIFWVPDFVYFNHEPHIRAEMKCQWCHGEVEKVDRFTNIVQFKMGFCLGCHNAKKATVDCFACHR